VNGFEGEIIAKLVVRLDKEKVYVTLLKLRPPIE